MKVLIVYFSKFGNTKMVAEAIRKTMEKGGDVRMVNSEMLEAGDFDNIGLVVMGSPTHKMNLPEAVRPVFEMLPKKILKGKLFATFDTSYEMPEWLKPFTAGKKLTQKLRKLGGKRVVPPEIFYVKAREGPLFEGEIERAGEWAISIIGRVEVKAYGKVGV